MQQLLYHLRLVQDEQGVAEAQVLDVAEDLVELGGMILKLLGSQKLNEI